MRGKALISKTEIARSIPAPTVLGTDPTDDEPGRFPMYKSFEPKCVHNYHNYTL